MMPGRIEDAPIGQNLSDEVSGPQLTSEENGKVQLPAVIPKWRLVMRQLIEEREEFDPTDPRVLRIDLKMQGLQSVAERSGLTENLPPLCVNAYRNEFLSNGRNNIEAHEPEMHGEIRIHSNGTQNGDVFNRSKQTIGRLVNGITSIFPSR